MPLFTFIETKLFSRLVGDYLSDEEYALLQGTLAANPETGNLVPGSGGVRVIYYVRSSADMIWMLTIYAKNEAQNIPAHILREIREEIDG